MTRFEDAMSDSDRMEQKALEAKDFDLRAFYHNASIGFHNRALNMTIEEAVLEGFHI